MPPDDRAGQKKPETTPKRASKLLAAQFSMIPFISSNSSLVHAAVQSFPSAIPWTIVNCPDKSSESQTPNDSEVRLLSRKMTVERAFRQYIEAMFEYLSRSETRLVRGWPDKKEVIREALRILELANRRIELRFEYLLKGHDADDAIWSSFANIASLWRRLDDEWQSSEEVMLKKVSPAYVSLKAETDRLQASLDKSTLDGLFRDAQRDGEYLDALRHMQDRLRELDKELAAFSAQ
jgi:hypothetical protein